MDRQRGILAKPRVVSRWSLFGFVSLALLWACGGTAPQGQPLRASQFADRPAVSMHTSKVLSKHALAYRVAIAGPYLASVELVTDFELVLRGIPGSEEQPKPRRVRIDAATYDINDLVLDLKHKRAFVASSAGWVRSYDLESLQMQDEWRTGSAATALALSEQAEYLLIGTDSGLVCLRRLSDGAQLQCMVAHGARIASLAISEGRVASASWQGEVALWGLPALNKIAELKASASVADLAFSPDGQMLAVTRNRRPPTRSQAVNDAEKKSFKVDPEGANAIDIHRVTETGIDLSPIHRLEGHRSLVTSLCWIGSDLLSGSWDRTVQLWNMRSGSRTWTLGDFGHIVRDLSSRQAGAGYAVASWGLLSEDSALSWGKLHYSH